MLECLFNEVAGLQVCKKQTPTQVFSCEYGEIFTYTYFEDNLRKAASVSLLIFLTTFNLFQPTVAIHIVTSHLICSASQLTGFYVKCKSGLKWICAKHVVKGFRLIKSQDFAYSTVKKWKCCLYSIYLCYFVFFSLKKITPGTRENAFYFTATALFILEIFKF